MRHRMFEMGQMMEQFPHAWAYWSLLLLVLLVLVIYLVARCSGWKAESGREDSPMEILKRRYARGEITKEEFEQFKRDLDL